MSDFGENRKKDTALTLNFPMFLCKHRMHQDCTKCIQWLHLGMHCHHQSDRREMLCSESYLKCNSGMCVCVHKNAHLQASRAQQLHTQSASAAVRLLRLHWEPMETSSLSFLSQGCPWFSPAIIRLGQKIMHSDLARRLAGPENCFYYQVCNRSWDVKSSLLVYFHHHTF